MSVSASDYDSKWPTLFEQEHTKIKTALGPFALAVGIWAARQFQISHRSRSSTCYFVYLALEEAKERCIELIEAIGYIYVPECASPIPASWSSVRDLRDRGPTSWAGNLTSPVSSASARSGRASRGTSRSPWAVDCGPSRPSGENRRCWGPSTRSGRSDCR
jgi:hypothetical protein